MGTSAVAKRTAPRAIEEVLHTTNAQAMLAPFLPEGVSPERVIAQAKMAVLKNPDLAKATPESLVMSVATILAWGLELGDTADILTFNNKKKGAGPGGEDAWVVEAQPNQRYTGQIQLMVASGAIRSIEPEVVYDGDEFEYQKGLNPNLVHRPCSDPKRRGRITGVYAIVRLPFGEKTFQYMSIEDVDAIRNAKSKSWSDEKIRGGCPPWYAKKTIVRQIAKFVPRKPGVVRALAAIEADTRYEFGLESGNNGLRQLASGGHDVSGEPDYSGHEHPEHVGNTREPGED
jgi:recombination protein RecT